MKTAYSTVIGSCMRLGDGSRGGVLSSFDIAVPCSEFCGSATVASEVSFFLREERRSRVWRCMVIIGAGDVE